MPKIRHIHFINRSQRDNRFTTYYVFGQSYTTYYTSGQLFWGVFYIQVTADISNTDTREREIRPYFKLNDQVLKLLVVNKPIKETMDENGFTIIGIADFLVRYIK